MRRITIAEATRRVIKAHPSLLDGILMDIVNYSALSRKILREVAKLTGDVNISVDSIKMALVRFSDELRRREIQLENRIMDILAKSTLELKNDVAVITIKQQPLLNKISKVIELSGSRFFQLTQGTETFSLVIDQRNLSSLIGLFEKRDLVMCITNQSALILISPEEIIHVPGIIAYITSILARRGINITQIISCHTDTVFIVDRKQAIDAYNALEEAILHLRRK